VTVALFAFVRLDGAIIGEQRDAQELRECRKSRCD
jgi:hypothetical protein